jgi:hypothetical protein
LASHEKDRLRAHQRVGHQGLTLQCPKLLVVLHRIQAAQILLGLWVGIRKTGGQVPDRPAQRILVGGQRHVFAREQHQEATDCYRSSGHRALGSISAAELPGSAAISNTIAAANVFITV